MLCNELLDLLGASCINCACIHQLTASLLTNHPDNTMGQTWSCASSACQREICASRVATASIFPSGAHARARASCAWGRTSDPPRPLQITAGYYCRKNVDRRSPISLSPLGYQAKLARYGLQACSLKNISSTPHALEELKYHPTITS